MGKRFLQVIVMPEDGGAVRTFRVPTRAVQLAAAGLLAVVLALATSLAFHVRTLRDAQQMAELRAENAELRGALGDFERATQSLKADIEAVGRSEREARLLAGLDPLDTETRQLGIGGQAPGSAWEKVRDRGLRENLAETGQRLEALQRHVGFQVRSYEEVLTTLEENREKLARTPTICPVQGGYTLSSGFGVRSDPFTGRWGHHNGLDFRAPVGTPIVCPADGAVAFAGVNGDYGLVVQLDHGDGVTTSYCHMDSAIAQPGDRVRRGQRIGFVGNSGRSTGPHLHYEVWLDGKPVDPSRYILTLTALVD
jgi:murein DD-endopeptidase MepM/ murein hydrolase activator NlpD